MLRSTLLACLFLALASCSERLDMAALNAGCPPDLETKPCGGRCVSVSDPAFGCGQESCTPCDVPNAKTALCDDEGNCVAHECQDKYKECDGKCVARDKPEFGCGGESCAPCFFPDSSATCVDGSCAPATCNPSMGDCDPAFVGCETNLLDSDEHCGACNRACDGADRCWGGVCEQVTTE